MPTIPVLVRASVRVPDEVFQAMDPAESRRVSRLLKTLPEPLVVDAADPEHAVQALAALDLSDLPERLHGHAFHHAVEVRTCRCGAEVARVAGSKRFELSQGEADCPLAAVEPAPPSPALATDEEVRAAEDAGRK